jgi:hypothetical protein
MPAWRNMSLTPAARPLCSAGAELSATWLTAGLNMPVPIMATSRPGRNSHHDESIATIVSSAWPAPISVSPPAMSTRAETFWPTDAVAPATKKLSIVPGT